MHIGELVAGTWKIETPLGEGGGAAVYAASHVRNGRRVAIKVLHEGSSCEPEILRRFEREGRLANDVGHPGAVRVYDDGVTADGCPFLVMELLEGETLEARRHSRGGKLSYAEALLWLREVLDILAAAHACGIVHRDVKPLNVFLTHEGRVKLLDFGIASSSRGGLTGIGIGTPLFMAPEQITGASEIGPQVDVWAAGVMLYKLVTGKYPFRARTLGELVEAQRKKPAALDLRVPGFPAAAARVIERALAVDASARWADAGEMARALDLADDEDSLRETASCACLPIEETVALATLPRLPVAPRLSAPSISGPGVSQVRPISTAYRSDRHPAAWGAHGYAESRAPSAVAGSSR